MVNPIPAIVVGFGTAFLIGFLTKGAIAVGVFEVPECEDFVAFITGCDDAFSQFIAYGILGTVPDAHPVVNGVMGVVGIGTRSTVIWAGIRLVRGGG